MDKMLHKNIMEEVRSICGKWDSCCEKMTIPCCDGFAKEIEQIFIKAKWRPEKKYVKGLHNQSNPEYRELDTYGGGDDE